MKAIVTRAKYEIRFSHYNVDGRKFRKLRKDEELRRNGLDRSETVCFLSNKKNAWIGEATVHPKDEFDIVVGRRIALTRALSSAGLSKKARTLVWKQYLASK